MIQLNTDVKFRSVQDLLHLLETLRFKSVWHDMHDPALIPPFISRMDIHGL